MMNKSMYHPVLVNNPWPIVSSIMVFNLFLNLFIGLFMKSLFSMTLCLTLLILSMLAWMLGYSKEFNLLGFHSFLLSNSLKFSFLLFILSEIMFFFSLFWSYFHFYLSPLSSLGLGWPPVNLVMFDYSSVPSLNTSILLFSGCTVTASHGILTEGKSFLSNVFLGLTILLGFLFSMFQFQEYNSSFFSIGDSSFGSVFFVVTGFHGFHVLVGAMYLSMVFLSSTSGNSNVQESYSFEMSSWYWHFVDVVWMFLFFFFYFMNSY